jgi:hypothetical protein
VLSWNKVRPSPRFHTRIPKANSDFSSSGIALHQRLPEARNHAKTSVNPKSGRQVPATA